MEIKATSTFDEKTIKAWMRSMLFKKADPKKRMLLDMILFAVLAVIDIFGIFWFGANFYLLMFLGTVILIVLLQCYLYFLLPKIRYNALGKMKGLTNVYTFGDDTIHATTDSDEFSGSSEIKYSFICQVKETKDYFFIFQSKTQVHIVDKSTVTGGTAEDIRNKLSSAVNGKYTVCDY